MSLVPPVEDAFLRYWFNGDATLPRICTGGGVSYLAICSASPGESGTSSNELRGRVSVTSWGTPAYDATNNRSAVRTTAEYSFGPGAAGVGTHLLLSDAPTTTHTFLDALVTSVTFGTSDTVRFRSGDIEVALSGLFSIDGGAGSPARRALDYLVGNATDAAPTTAYWGLSTTAPNPDGSNVTEPTGVGSYARVNQAVTSTFSGSTTGSSPTTHASTAAIVWPGATASWGTVSHWVAYDALTGGSLMYYGALDSPVEVASGLEARFAIGDLIVSCD